MATKKNATKTEATSTNDMIDAGVSANAPAPNPTPANQVVASDCGSDERSAQRLKKTTKRVAPAPTPEPAVENTMVEGGLATDFRSDAARADAAAANTARQASNNMVVPAAFGTDDQVSIDIGAQRRVCAKADRSAARKTARKTEAKEVVKEAIATTTAEVAAAPTYDDERRARAVKANKMVREHNEAAPAPKAKKGKNVAAPAAATIEGDATLSRVADHYLKHLEERGAGAGTIASYGMELKTAMSELGAATRIADLTPARVQEFFDCARVTLLKNGKEKSPLSIAKTRRVLRLALVHATDTGLIAAAPVPEKSPAA